MRLRQIHNGVFLRFNKATLNMLRSVNTYVTYGTPNVKAVRELVYKRGFANVNKQRIAITDNSVIEKQLGKVRQLQRCKLSQFHHAFHRTAASSALKTLCTS